MLPVIFYDLDHSLVEVFFSHHLPLQHYPHAFCLYSCHGVIVVPEKRDPHHWDAVVHGFIDAVEPPMAEESPDIWVTLKNTHNEQRLLTGTPTDRSHLHPRPNPNTHVPVMFRVEQQ